MKKVLILGLAIVLFVYIASFSIRDSYEKKEVLPPSTFREIAETIEEVGDFDSLFQNRLLISPACFRALLKMHGLEGVKTKYWNCATLDMKTLRFWDMNLEWRQVYISDPEVLPFVFSFLDTGVGGTGEEYVFIPDDNYNKTYLKKN